MVVFLTYALVQANQLGGATPTYDVYDSDNYPQVNWHACNVMLRTTTSVLTDLLFHIQLMLCYKLKHCSLKIQSRLTSM